MYYYKTILLLLIVLFYGRQNLVYCNSWRSEEISLDLDGKYRISWEVDEGKELVIFNVNVQTTGYIGLGISSNGGMKGADYFIGGVDDQGSHYHSDRYLPVGVPNSQPLIDDEDNWTVLNATEENGATSLRFSRLLNTCDDQDYPITEDDTVRLIWAFGRKDTFSYHGTQRGTISFSIKNPEAHQNISMFSSWKMTINSTMPSYDTSYWCTIHKRPALKVVNHIVGFDAYLENSLAKRHTHHFIIYKCRTPIGHDASEIFEHHVGNQGEECYGERSYLPKHFCTEYIFVWATGGLPTWFPEDVGYPVAEFESPYYMMEIHYDNPEQLENISFRSGVIIYHTEILREKKAGLLTVGVGEYPNPSLTIPPNEPNFVVAGHCGSTCTNHFQHPISVFNILLHSHISGRKLTLRHFREEKEMPWMLRDSNYDFNFQQNKPIKEHIKVLPGDHLTYECIYDSTWNNNKIVYGGLSTRSEMCQAFLWYYPRIKVDFCGSTYDYHQNFQDFGITSYDLESSAVSSGEITPIIRAPEEMAGLNYTTALSTKFNWTKEFRKNFQKKRRFGDMNVTCISRSPYYPITQGHVKYPHKYLEYTPHDKCKAEDSSAWNSAAAVAIKIPKIAYLTPIISVLVPFLVLTVDDYYNNYYYKDVYK